jgi:hypothetical protein
LTKEAPKLLRATTYRVGKPRPETLRLWSIQPLTTWEQLRRYQSLYVDLDKIDDPDFILNYLWMYDWMREQMAQRLPNYGGHYPWWAYFRPKPDLRRKIWEIEAFGTRYVRLELAIEPDRVLLSNLEAWWSGMGDYCFVAFDDSDGEAWKSETEQQGLGFASWPLPEPWHTRRVASWERIFDLDALARGGKWPGKLQATFERLDLADVVAVTEFTARGCSFHNGP